MLVSEKQIAQRVKELEKEKEIKEIACELGLTVMDVHNIIKRKTISGKQAEKLGYKKVTYLYPVGAKI